MMLRALSVVAALSLLACGPGPEAGPDLAAQIPVTIGQAYDRGGTRLPVVIENLTGRDQEYVQVTCAFYDDAGTLIESAFANWNNVPAGARVSSEVLPETRSAARIDCVPSL